MSILSGDELEAFGKRMFEQCGLDCIRGNKQVQLRQLTNSGNFSDGDHLEIDYVIPYENTCLVGEITSRSSSRSIKNKYDDFKKQLELLAGQRLTGEQWKLLGVEGNDLPKFTRVTQIKGFFILNAVEKYDVNLEPVDNIAIFYKSDLNIISSYSECIGTFYKNGFLQKFNLNSQIPTRPLLLSQQNNNLLRLSNKVVTSDTINTADIFSFSTSPYHLLEIAEVYRRDQLPDLNIASRQRYQRPLISEKIFQIRSSHLCNENFMFPNSILVVLSSDCIWDEVTSNLTIPDTYGAISVIDGQHRLFSYADTTLQINDPKIMVTGLRFYGNPDEILKISAKTFIEINMRQTSVDSSHLDGISFEILGDKSPRAIASSVVIDLNETRGALHGLILTNKSIKAKIPAKTLTTTIKQITDIKLIEKLCHSNRVTMLLKKRGYENILDRSVSQLSNANTLKERTSISLRRYYGIIKSTFRSDWPTRGTDINSNLRYAKFVSAFLILFIKFIKEGRDWDFIQQEIGNLKNNLMALRSMAQYDQIIFNNSTAFPQPRHSANQIFKFLDRNRQQPENIDQILNPN